jgi:hypothetical protein
MDSVALRERIRDLLANRRLPGHSANQIRASFGDGTVCAVCGRATHPSTVKYELRFGGADELRSIFMHHDCFDVYERERALSPELLTPATPVA